MRRRARLLLFVLCVPAAGLVVSCASAAPPGTVRQPGSWVGSSVVMTRYGAVRGYPDAEHTWVWVAIPFARPPVGELRWRAPQDPVPWNGVRGPRLFNSGCTQYSSILPKSILGSEDCLYLNIWRPQTAARGLPVYVWIHGGGNSTGSATIVPDYYGNGVADKSNMVFVSMNYRLGPFGWFTLPAFRDGAAPEDASGNFGTLDIIAALRWIHENITAFGGDPGNVTVTGESAGGFNVLSLLIAPPAKGLFHRAMSESGAAITRGIDEADARARKALEHLLVEDGTAGGPATAGVLASEMTPERVRSYLRSKSDREILRSYNSVILGILDNPAVLRDGTVIAAGGFDALTTGDYPNKVPLIVGSNREELKLFLFMDSSIPWQSDLYAAISRFGSERWKASGVDEVARRLSRHPDQPPVYAYEFSWGAPDDRGRSVLPFEWGRRLGAFHSLEVPFFLGTETLDGILQSLLFTAWNEEGRRALSRAMMTYAASFARSGDPNPPGAILPAWTPWVNTPGANKCIIFDVSGDRPSLVMSSRELTDEGVLASLRAELPDPLRMETLRALAASVLPASIR